MHFAKAVLPPRPSLRRPRTIALQPRAGTVYGGLAAACLAVVMMSLAKRARGGWGQGTRVGKREK